MAVLTAGLRNLQRQLDDAFPDRAGPDGWIGDPDHQDRTSGHNPDDTTGSRPAWDGDPDTVKEVRALDVKTRLDAGVDGQDLVDHLTGLPGLAGVVRYLIHRGRIYHARTGFEPETYDGDNAHNEHVHIEGAWTQAADNNTTFNYRFGDMIPMALDATDKAWFSAELAKLVTLAPFATGGGSGSPVGNAALGQGWPLEPGQPRTADWANMQQIYLLLKAVKGVVDDIRTALPGPVGAQLNAILSGLDQLTADPAETGFAHPSVAAAEYAEDHEPPA